MARPRLSELTRQALLEEGLTSFLRQGYHGTGLKAALDRVNVPKGSFYNYFESKEAYAVAVIEHYADCIGRKMAAALADAPDPITGLRRFFEQQMESFAQANYIGGCLVANLGGELEGSEVCRAALARAMTAWRDGVCDALQAAQAAGLARADMPAEDMADLLVEAWEGAVIRMKIERSLAPLQRCVRMLLDGYLKA